MKANEKSAGLNSQAPEKDSKVDKSKIPYRKGHHSFECGGFFFFYIFLKIINKRNNFYR